jgi:hypothetical protein
MAGPVIFNGINARLIVPGTLLNQAGDPISVPKYADFASLPVTANEGDSAIAEDTGTLYIYFSGSWQVAAAPGVILLVGALDGQAKNANAATVAANTIYLQTADTDWPGVLSAADWDTFNNKEPAITAATAADYYRGDKTFQPLTGAAVAYTPADATDWDPDPTTVAGALDQLADFERIENEIYVAKNGDDTAGNGSIRRPYLTIQQAATVIGAAASNADFNDASLRYYRINVGPGVYTESVTFGTRPQILLNLDSANIVGNVTVQFDQGAISGAGLQSPHFIIKGVTARGVAGGLPTQGITGNVVYESVGSGSSLVAILEHIGIAIQGGITQQLGAGGGTFTLTHFIRDSIVTGTIANNAGGGSHTLYINNADDSSSNAIGAINGVINLNILSNVRLNGIVDVSGSQSGRWFDVTFAAVAHDFTGATGTISADANSYSSYFVNVPTKGSETFTLLDRAIGVRFTPAGNLVATDVQAAIEELDTEKQATGNYITALTGDVTATGPGSVAATIALNAVTNAKMAQMAANTFKGNNTGGASDPLDLTATQATAILDVLVGDSGAGGTKGLVPAPASGDAAANRFLKADGTWDVPAGAGSGTVNAGTAGRLALYPASADTVDDIYVQNGNDIDVIIAAHAALGAARTYTVPDSGASASFVMSDGAQTLNGIKTFNAVPLLKAGLDIEDPGAGTFKVSIIAPVLGADYTLTLPVDDGASGEVLSTDGNGVLSWVANGSGSGTVNAGTAGRLSLYPASAAAVDDVYQQNGNDITVAIAAHAGLAAARAYTIPDAGADASFIMSESAQTLSGVKTFNAVPLFKAGIDIEDPGAGTNKITIIAPTLAGDYTLTLPEDNGGANQFLQTDGNGVLTWASASGASPLTTKGDLYTYDTGDQRLAVGTDGRILVADSTTATGLAWSDPDGVKKRVTQNSHGFSVGDVVYYNGSSWAEARADVDSTSEVLGVVSVVPDANTFVVTQLGYISGLSGLSAGTTYYLSAATAGALTATEPSAAGQVSKPVLVAVSTTEGYVIHSRGAVIASQSGSQMGEWASYTPTLSAGFGTTTNVRFRYKQVGDSLHVRGTFNMGTVAASLGTISLPAGFTISATNLSNEQLDSESCPKYGWIQSDSANQFAPIVVASDSSTTVVYTGRTLNVASAMFPANVSTQFTSNGLYSVEFEVPIVV